MNRQNILKTAIMLAATLLIAACTNDEMADSQPETLPEGMYPLTFTATQADIVASPQTRVTDSDVDGVHKSKWTANDQIKIKVSEGGNDMETTCTLKDDGSIGSYTPPVYWKTTQESKINAWYSNIEKQNTTSSTVSLTDQSKGLAYVLKADEVTNAKYNSKNISLNFKHQLAKVRVKLEKRIYEDDLSAATVKMKGCYTSCIVSNGAVTEGGTTGDITMHKATYGNDTYYEANVVPGTTLNGEAFEISLKGVTKKAKLKNGIMLTKGNVHTITLAIDNRELTEITGGGTIYSPGDYIMTGEITETVTLDGNAINLILKDVNVAITGQNRPAIEIKSGSPVITVVGKNNVLSSGQWGGIILENGASIKIVGNGKENSSLTVTAGDNNESGASTVGIGAKQNVACGNISISNVALTVTGGDILPGSEIKVGAAAIGTSSEPPSSVSETKCGNITITNARVNATGGAGAAAIGIGSQAFGDPGNILTCGIIRIEKSELIVTIKPSKVQNYGAGIGIGVLKGATVNCGKIILDKSSGELETFTAKWAKSETGGNSTYKIGKGYIYREGTVTFDGVYLKGNNTEKADYLDGWGSWP